MSARVVLLLSQWMSRKARCSNQCKSYDPLRTPRLSLDARQRGFSECVIEGLRKLQRMFPLTCRRRVRIR